MRSLRRFVRAAAAALLLMRDFLRTYTFPVEKWKTSLPNNIHTSYFSLVSFSHSFLSILLRGLLCRVAKDLRQRARVPAACSTHNRKEWEPSLLCNAEFSTTDVCCVSAVCLCLARSIYISALGRGVRSPFLSFIILFFFFFFFVVVVVFFFFFYYSYSFLLGPK